MAAVTTIDFATLLRGLPAGAWVAISERTNQVLAYGVEIQKVVDLAHERGEEHPLIVRVPERATSLFL